MFIKVSQAANRAIMQARTPRNQVISVASVVSNRSTGQLIH